MLLTRKPRTRIDEQEEQRETFMKKDIRLFHISRGDRLRDSLVLNRDSCLWIWLSLLVLLSILFIPSSVPHPRLMDKRSTQTCLYLRQEEERRSLPDSLEQRMHHMIQIMLPFQISHLMPVRPSVCSCLRDACDRKDGVFPGISLQKNQRQTSLKENDMTDKKLMPVYQ